MSVIVVFLRPLGPPTYELEKQLQELQRRVGKLETGTKDQLSMVVFSGDLDKILAAMIIATGAAAYDMKVKLFFTFWAISAMRDSQKKGKGKNMMEKMFGMMLPRGSAKVKLSNMNMGKSFKFLTYQLSMVV